MSPAGKKDSPAVPPLPPADLASRELPVRTLPPTVLFRIHRNGREPIFFGPPGAEPESRFDDPQGRYKVCYLGHFRPGAFVETLLREPMLRFITWTALQERRMAWIETSRDLSLVDFDGPGLRVLGTTLEVLGTRDYTLPGAWSRALYEHPARPDGIYYPCRHDNREYAIALFDRARGALSHLRSRPLSDDRDFLAEMVGRYRFAIA